MNKSLLNYILTSFDTDLEKNHALLFLTKLALNIDIDFPIEETVINKLTRDNIIERDYINNKFILKVSFFENGELIEGNLKTFDKITSVEKEVSIRIDEYRTLFKGFRIGNMGNRKTCINYMIRFILQNDYTFDEILQATHYYINHTEMKYITSAENFIYRTTNNGEESKLYTILEELRLIRNESNLL